MSKEWIPLPGFPGYEGTVSGRCRSRRTRGCVPRLMGTPYELKPQLIGRRRPSHLTGTALGYVAYHLTAADGRRRKVLASQVARMVAEAEAPGPEVVA